METHQVDLSDNVQLSKLLENLKQHNFYAIVNNAGVIHFELFDNLNLDNWEHTFAVNLTAPLEIVTTMKHSNIR